MPKTAALLSRDLVPLKSVGFISEETFMGIATAASSLHWNIIQLHFLIFCPIWKWFFPALIFMTWHTFLWQMTNPVDYGWAREREMLSLHSFPLFPTHLYFKTYTACAIARFLTENKNETLTSTTQCKYAEKTQDLPWRFSCKNRNYFVGFPNMNQPNSIPHPQNTAIFLQNLYNFGSGVARDQNHPTWLPPLLNP